MRVLHVGHGFSPFHHGGLVAYTEDLMRAELARGHEVHYFCTGRHYPLMQPRLVARTRDGVRMHELINSPVMIGPVERGTRRPDLDVSAPVVDRALRRVVDAVRPDVVHVHELGGLPSSALGVPRASRVPVLMTLQDFFPLCPTIKLFDIDGNNCRRLDPAPVCVRCCRDAPGPREAVVATLGHHRRLVEKRLPGLTRVPGPRTLARRLRARRAGDGPPAETPQAAGDVDAFRARRALNVRRLNEVDCLVAMSPRVAEVYTELGVEPERLRTMRLTLAHIEQVRPRRTERIEGPMRFVTLNGAATRAKGSEVLADALEQLRADGFTESDLTLTLGGVPDPDVADRLAATGLVRLWGGYSSADLDAILDGCHVGIVPSVWEEAFGYVGVEMLAKGLPVIGSALGGIVEYVRDGETGWRTDATASGLASTMAQIVRAPEEVVALHRKVVDRRGELVLPMSEHVRQMEALYGELVGQSSRTAASLG